MSATLEQVDRRVGAAEELMSVTHTMKGLAAVNARHFEQAAAALDDYEAIVDRGLQVIAIQPEFRVPGDAPANRRSPGRGPLDLIVFGSNQGLCGPINRHMVRHVIDAISKPGVEIGHVFAVGARLGTELELAGIDPDVHVALPNTVEGITPRADELLLRIDRRRQERPDASVTLVYPRFEGRRRSYRPSTRPLLPFDTGRLDELRRRPWPTNQRPMSFSPSTPMLTALIRQALFVAVHRSFAQTMASVAASRLAAMESAQRDIEERLDDLQAERHRLRQSAITEELLDVVSGFAVLEAQ